MDAIGPIEALMILAVTVVVPLGLRLAADGGRRTPPLRLATLAAPVGALAAIGAFLVPHRGATAAALAAPWLVVTVFVAAHGVARLLRGGIRWSEIAIPVGCALLPVGGAWLLVSRLGAEALGFEEPIPLLTAVHFHYAVFATLVIIGMAGQLVGDSGLYRAIVCGAVAGPLLLAAGITFSPVLEVVAAVLVVVTLACFAVVSAFRVAPRLEGLPRLLITASSIAILAGMGLALAYALGEFTGRPVISLGRMARLHGPINALGFALCGLLGWTLAVRSHRPPPR